MRATVPASELYGTRKAGLKTRWVPSGETLRYEIELLRCRDVGGKFSGDGARACCSGRSCSRAGITDGRRRRDDQGPQMFVTVICTASAQQQARADAVTGPAEAHLARGSAEAAWSDSTRGESLP